MKIASNWRRVRGHGKMNRVSGHEKINHMKKCFSDSAIKWGAEVRFDYKRHYTAYTIDGESEVVKVGQEAGKNLDLDSSLRTTLGGSDANIYNAKGVPTIVMATGMDKIHTHDEFISRVDLVKTAELVLEVIRVAAKTPTKSH